MAEPPPALPPAALPALAAAIRAWSDNHPDPDAPVFGFPDGSVPLTPRGLAERMSMAAAGHTHPEVNRVLWLYSHAAAAIGIDELIGRLLALSQLRPRGGFLVR
jgi:hypothetical protein